VFLREMDQCWLHCPDHVLRAGYRFIDSVKTGANSTGEDRAKAFSEFMVAIREDLISGSRVTQSSMRADEYQVIKLNLQVPQGRSAIATEWPNRRVQPTLAKPRAADA
jgi:hypothetical protein